MTLERARSYDFFLGGYDLEMITIKTLLEHETSGQLFDKHLTWGAKASAYREEIANCVFVGRTPVLIELENNIEPCGDSILVLDHHGEFAGANRPTSLHQVFHLLQLPDSRWTRWHTLVAANDRGHVTELIQVGATPEEIIQIRAADRQAQGITPEDEEAAARSISQAEKLAGDQLTVVRLPHAKGAAVSDQLDPALGGSGYRNLLVISPDEINFYGEGTLIKELTQFFPDSWSGGAMPKRGFWGTKTARDQVLPFLLSSINRTAVN
jgi:hypothetical protein